MKRKRMKKSQPSNTATPAAPVTDQQVQQVVTGMTEDQAKASNYWQAVATAIDALNNAAALPTEPL